MNKSFLAELLRKEVRNLHYLIDCVEDESSLGFPDCYDCRHTLSEIISSLRKTERMLEKTPCLKKQQKADYEREWLALK